jgi:hypothetical protein
MYARRGSDVTEVLAGANRYAPAQSAISSGIVAVCAHHLIPKESPWRRSSCRRRSPLSGFVINFGDCRAEMTQNPGFVCS